jgi:hypothetical protein
MYGRHKGSSFGVFESELDRERKARRDLEAMLAEERRARMDAEASAAVAGARLRLVSSKMSMKVRNAVIRALHPDLAAHSTKQSREEALKLFTQEMAWS